MPRPSPRLPPVTMTLAIAADQFPGGGDVEGGDDPNHRRNLVRSKAAAAELPYPLLEPLGVAAITPGIARKSAGGDVGTDAGADGLAIPPAAEQHRHDRGPLDN